MLPLTSNNSATLTPLTSLRKSAIGAHLTSLEHLEVPRRQVPHEPPLAIPDNGRDAHEIDARLERGRLRCRGLTPGGGPAVRPQGKGQNGGFNEERAAGHQPPILQGVCQLL